MPIENKMRRVTPDWDPNPDRPIACPSKEVQPGVPVLIKLQTGASDRGRTGDLLERETGLEPATSTLGRWHSTIELLPHLVPSFCY